ncbi:MAG: hemerythrin family protein [Fibrobacteres bacterium]|jgi:hemerythrin|nr:hemerythrin family protein [Fibrobacterota bacterium]
MADFNDVQVKHLLINWADVMSVKNTEMDADHMQLVNLINELYEAMWMDQAQGVIQKCLDSLKHYVRYHFQAEEELMAKASFPGLKDHQAVHLEFIANLAEMEKLWQEGDLGVLEQLMDMLQGWLVDHIMKIDMQYSAFLRKN